MIYIDTNHYDEAKRFILTKVGTIEDLERLKIELQEGLKLVFYTDDADDDGKSDDLVAEGIVEYDKENNRWVARVDWNEFRNISKIAPEDRVRLGLV